MTLRSFPRRRTLARMIAMLPFAVLASLRRADAQSKTFEPTPPDAEGPFYPRSIPAEADFDLTRIAGRSKPAEGTPLAVSGRVLAQDGKPLGGARVELWQCDSHGHYHHVGGSAGDEGFQGYGVVTTDAEGRYAFRTIRPVPYASRPPHLHFKIAHARARPLTTQLYPRGESAERGMGFGVSGREARSRLEFALMPGSEPHTLAASYDFVLRAV
jgi:protocatechuate 3,4-dioxygenase beta subunit